MAVLKKGWLRFTPSITRELDHQLQLPDAWFEIDLSNISYNKP